MFDRFSIDFRGLEEDRRRLGGGMGRIGGLAEGRRRHGGGSEEDWRRIGGGLEEDLRMCQ